ncbi:TPR-like protein [Clavulina sp. PMI_390]|nr:TPR-like protein [Clavulina sp. PMI_390]
MSTRISQSVLQTEALVQRSPEDAGLWFQLGVKQQENEQEDKAVEALQKALQLDPTHAAALLALAVSQTNENNRVGALEAIEQWIDIQGRGEYADAISRHRALNGEVKKELEAGASMRGQMAARQKDLLECLMTMARMSPDGAIDADVQIALGILLNSSEDYDMAKDCFQSALSVRPDEPQLYNRVGATLANSGRASEALAYYYRALELNPSYIRARFNLGISSVNLSMYEEAAGHFLDALVLQDLDANEGQNTGGISSSALWDSLRATCLHLQRPDLVALCDARDLPSTSSRLLCSCQANG